MKHGLSWQLLTLGVWCVLGLLFILEIIGGHGIVMVDDPRLDIVRKKGRLTVLITDSGLGGLSVAADLARRAEASGMYQSLDIVFANALPDGQHGYNQLASMEEKARVFSAALDGMHQRYHPDVILIACNTLSVVYTHTAFAARADVPVVGIVEIGAAMMADRLRSDTTASLLLFGTETTIGEDAHRSALRVAGISDRRMYAQACPDLAGEIQQDAGSDVVRTMIDLYAEDAVRGLGAHSGPTLVGLCCTHFGYASKAFAAAVGAATAGPVEIVNPNDRMADVLLPLSLTRRFPTTTVTQHVVSRAALGAEEISSIARLLEPVSLGTAQALRSYERVPDLFPFPVSDR